MRSDIDIAKDNAIRDAEMLVSALNNVGMVFCVYPSIGPHLKELEESLDDLRELVRLEKIGDDIDRAESILEER